MLQVAGQRVDDLISRRLKRKQLLLIIDNCEHVVGEVAVLADAIQRNDPNVRSRGAALCPGDAG
jgi:predicted ATPase